MSTLRPRDFIACGELLAAVTSTAHAEGAVVTPRYLRRGGTLEKLGTAAGHEWVRTHHPGWLVHSALLGAEVVLVPACAITGVWRPEARAAQLLDGSATSVIERRAAGVLAALVGEGVPAERLGLTGSLLVGAATERSDVDVVTYGRAAFATARRALATLVARGAWQPLRDDDWREAWSRRGAPGTFDAYRAHERRKAAKAMADGTRLDLSLLQDPGEGAPERPPYRKLARLEIEAEVTDASAAFDLPARYVVRHDAVGEVVSWTATYAGQALAGERVRAAGWLEEDATGARRLLVGTSREAEGESLVVIPGAA